MIKNNLISLLTIFMLILSFPGLHADNLTSETNEETSQEVQLEEQVVDENLEEEEETGVIYIPLEDLTSEKNETITEEENTTEEIIENETSLEIPEDNTTFYVPIENITPVKPSTTSSGSSNAESKVEIKQNETVEDEEVIGEEIKEKVIRQVYYEEGEKVLEIETSVNENNKEELEIADEIEIEDSLIEEGKEVIISSKEHFNNEIIISSKLEEPTKKENIKIYWDNKDSFIKNIEYLDENEDGLIEEVSWVVPHLSTQVFKIIIEKDSTGTSTSVGMSGGPSGIVTNPIEFDLGIDFVNESDLNCSIEIKDESLAQIVFSYSDENFNLTQDLPNGNYTWSYSCWDETNPSNEDELTGSFEIAEEFEISGNQSHYLLNWEDYSFAKTYPDVVFYNGNGEDIVINLLGPVGSYTTLGIGGKTLLKELLIPTPKGIGTHKMNIEFGGLEESYVVNKTYDLTRYKFTTFENITEDISTGITLQVESSKTIDYIIMHFGEGPSQTLPVGTTTFTNQYSKIYPSTGNQNIHANIYFADGNTSSTPPQTIEVKAADDTSSNSNEDDTDPDIELIYPEDDELLRYKSLQSTINFEFSVDEENELDSCEFKIYDASQTQLGWDLQGEVWSQSLTNDELKDLEDNKEVTIPMDQFDEQGYAWEVKCKDNSSNEGWWQNYFEVSYSGETNFNGTTRTSSSANYYEREQEVAELIEIANGFIDKEETWEADEKKALEDLGLIKNVKTYKSQLVDVDQFFKYNIDYVPTQSLKDTRIEENNELIDEISKNLPKNIEITDDYEYIKNGNSFEWKELLESYFEETNTKISGSIKGLANTNEFLQNGMSVASTIKELEIEYVDRTESMILVTKEVKSQPEGNEKILEIFPKELADKFESVNFLTDVKIIKENEIYEILSEELTGEIKYTLKNKDMKIKEMESTDTVAFTDKIVKKSFTSAISGFAFFDALGSNGEVEMVYVGVIPLIIAIILFVLIMLYRFIKRLRLKKDPNVFKIFDLIEEIRKHLRANEITDAREKYHKIQELYLMLEDNAKKTVLALSKRALRAIDKKDIFNLTKEYKLAKSKFQKEEALELQAQISQIYTRLYDKKDRERVKKVITDI